ncbi:tRNA dihydrouridine synthase DusB [Dehalobacterium formicoaceticum]|uniref:tRNA dihydrouridine synthase DusB n=1 Tax=Dehalobacterium formicoaceticum TaxID=51515 RepID=UPI000B7E046B|nr:tRNA dihydrouridine synthase DusB [Dehalobacterium formicoaceticum]
MKIGSLVLANPVISAPMAGITDKAFREILKSMGAGMVSAEMVSDKALTYGNRNTLELLDIQGEASPLCVQIFGSEPDVMAEAAVIVAEMGAHVIDINMGCPAPKIVRNGEGSALMRHPILAGEIIQAVVQAVQVPVTVKMRKGWDESSVNALEIAQIAEKMGAAAITVHGRTRDQFYSGQADWSIIRRVKQAVAIPVLGNGDIWSAEDGLRMMEATGCDGVMIARGMLGNPWLVQNTVAMLKDGGETAAPDLEVRMALARAHLARVVELKGEVQGIKQMRKHLAWYIRGIRDASRIRTEINRITRQADLDRLLLSLV